MPHAQLGIFGVCIVFGCIFAALVFPLWQHVMLEAAIIFPGALLCFMLTMVAFATPLGALELWHNEFNYAATITSAILVPDLAMAFIPDIVRFPALFVRPVNCSVPCASAC